MHMTERDHDGFRAIRTALVELTYRVNRFFLPYQDIDAGTLKIIAIVTMFIDHLTFAFLELPAPGQTRLKDALPNGVLLDSVGRTIGRTALPIFAFLIVEGYVHTRSRVRYLLRLLLFAILSAYPFRELFYPYDHKSHYDTLFTLALGLIAIWVIDEVLLRYLGRGSRRRSEAGTRRQDSLQMRIVQILVRLAVSVAVTALCCVVATRYGTDYRYGGVLLVVLFYLFRDLRIVGVILGYVWMSWYNANEIYALVGMFLVQRYNGQRGRQFKYLFYLFYPGHLYLLLLVRRMTLGF